jgi:hypothetical protein
MGLLQSAAVSLLFVISTLCIDLTIDYPDQLADGPVSVEFISRENNLDGPKIPGAANETTYDWYLTFNSNALSSLILAPGGISIQRLQRQKPH